MPNPIATASWLEGVTFDDLALAPEDRVETPLALEDILPVLEPAPEPVNYARFLTDDPEIGPDYPDDIDADSPGDPWMDRFRHEFPGDWPPEPRGEAQMMAEVYGGLDRQPLDLPDGPLESLSVFEDEDMESAAARADALELLEGRGDFGSTFAAETVPTVAMGGFQEAEIDEDMPPPLREGLDDFPTEALEASWGGVADPAQAPLEALEASQGDPDTPDDDEPLPSPQAPLTPEEDAELPAARPVAQRASRRLRAETIGSRLSFTWMGVSKVLTKAQIQQAAEVFNADSGSVSARKRILNTRNAKFRVLNRVRHDVRAYWKETTLPFPEVGVRLIRQDQVELFDRRMQNLALRMAVAVRGLAEEMEALKAEARANLGILYNEADYPVSLAALFGVEWSYPTVEPPDISMQLKPSVYKREMAKVQAQFEQAAAMAEDAFRSQLADVATRLTRQLRGNEDGSPKVIREAHVAKVNAFLDRFRTLNIGGDAQMEALVADAEAAMNGVEVKALRSDAGLRATLADSMGAVAAALDDMMTDRPRRMVTIDDDNDTEDTDTEGGGS